MLITSTQIVALCSKLASLSSNQAGLTTADFLNFANLGIAVLTAEILGAREEFLIYSESQPVIVGQAAYRIPYRAINGIVRHLWLENASGERSRLFPQMIEDMENYSSTMTGVPTGFYVMGNTIVLLPTPNAPGNLVMAYPFRPGLLVDGFTTQSITSVGTSSVTLPNVPANFVSGIPYDIIDHLSGNGILHYDLIGTVSGNTITFPQAIPLAKAGNFIAQAGQSPIPQIPEEGHPLLLEMTVMRVEMVRGNASRVKNSTTVIQDTRKAWDALLNNRIISKPHPAGSGGAQYPQRPW